MHHIHHLLRVLGCLNTCAAKKWRICYFYLSFAIFPFIYIYLNAQDVERIAFLLERCVMIISSHYIDKLDKFQHTFLVRRRKFRYATRRFTFLFVALQLFGFGLNILVYKSTKIF